VQSCTKSFSPSLEGTRTQAVETRPPMLPTCVELQALLLESRELPGRLVLACAGVPSRLAAALPSFDASGRKRELLLSLRLLRNVCAGVEAAKEQLLEQSTHVHLAALSTRLLEAPCDTQQLAPLLACLLQLVGNSCVSHEPSQAATW